jgi:hypothetical protein
LLLGLPSTQITKTASDRLYRSIVRIIIALIPFTAQHACVRIAQHMAKART